MIVSKVRRFLHRTGMPHTSFGRAATNDPRLVEDLLNGRQPRKETVARIEAFIARHAGDAR
ncbi:hypothetical protein ACFSC3_09330 [Sphingomonas floccifaciens]|uniref:XRE family transcriptional regulator n=1 Tax=Sphingomonas floccifaciens TaxID=1844115 RepID=A0ABW4NG41_9SPHN